MKTILFGASAIAEAIISDYSQSWDIIAIADNDSSKHGQRLVNIEIIAPSEIESLEPEQIVIACSYPVEVRQQLTSLGLANRIKPSPPPKRAATESGNGIRGETFLPSLARHSNENGNLLYDRRQALMLLEQSEKFCETAPQKFLHIGPRFSLGLELSCTLLHGWSSLSIEPYPEFPDSYSPRKHAALLSDLFKVLHDRIQTSAAISELDLEFSEFGQPRHIALKAGNCHIDFRAGTLFEATTVQSNSVDLCYSNAVLEHVSDVSAFLEKSYQILRPGGIALHQVDMRDHRNFNAPLGFLQYSEEEWQQCQCDFLNFHQNRYRDSEYKKAFKDTGFELVDFKPDTYADMEELERIRVVSAPRFKSLPLSDWKTIGALYVARKPQRNRK